MIYALKHGMVVGNHSYSHPDFAEIPYEEGISEIEKCEALLDDIYKKTGVERKYRPFRFPYGSKGGKNKENYEKYFKDSGFSMEDVIKRVHARDPVSGAMLLEDGTNHIILMHDHEETLAMVPDYYKIMLEHIMENGVSFPVPEFI